jgi:transcriptional regulator, carD family protein
MFNLNDAVVYSSYGVCIVSAIEKRDFSGESIEYYILRPVSDSKNTFYVPTSNSVLTNKMRSVFSRKEAEELIRTMPGEKFVWIDNELQRKDACKKIIENGNRRELVRLIKSLYTHKKILEENHKRLHSSDEHFLHDAENMLYDELAYALEIPKSEVVDYICAQIDN